MKEMINDAVGIFASNVCFLLTELFISFSCIEETIWNMSGRIRGSDFQHWDMKAYNSAVQFWGIGKLEHIFEIIDEIIEEFSRGHLRRYVTVQVLCSFQYLEY